MAKVAYSKPALSYAQQLQQLKDRGLTIDNDAKALHVLEHVSYYRLSGYWYPLLADKTNHIFKPDAKFDTAFQIYCFDRKLRQLTMSEIEKIEIAVRAKMIYVLSHKHGAFWFQNTAIFKNPGAHGRSLARISDEYDRSDEQFVTAYESKYSDPLPPSWITMEITSFGTLSMLYQNLKSSRDRRDIAVHFGLSDTVFESWLHSIVYLRNLCAHHSRMWNRAMSISPLHPHNPHKQWLINTAVSNRKAYYMLSIISYFLQTANPHHTFHKKFKQLLIAHPTIDPGALGCPVNWEQEPLWGFVAASAATPAAPPAT